MQFSKETIAILKNFSGINSNILLRPGNKLATISAQKNILAEVSIPETLPVEFGIYDLSEFLGIISLSDSPDIEFTSKSAIISDGVDFVEFKPSDPGVLTLPPEKKINFPTPDVVFELTASDLNKLIRYASVMKLTDVSVIGKDGVLSICAFDLKNSLSNNFKHNIGTTDKTFQANIKVDNLKMIQQDYTVSISSKKISRWVAKTNDMTIFVAIEANSTF
jgi:hypothetical protein